MQNPLLGLLYEPALESLGDDYYDRVAAAEFPQHLLRFRNNAVLKILGLQPEQVSDQDFIEALGQFQGREPFLALRYHGYQFGEYNSRLGDGRGFLYGQVRGQDGELYDFGTKGSGTTPYSRGGDGRLTLKGGVREVLASETLVRSGVFTSRCLSLIETGESLWRGDEPSPTRSSVMVRFSRSHIRFGTFERLHAFNRPDLIRKLLDHVIAVYYPHLASDPDRDAKFYAELVRRTGSLAAQWMAAGFCHAVLNTDNMSITGESFDYGPFAFIPTYDVQFTAAYFDYYGRYSYGNQPTICRLNLELLQKPLALAIAPADLDAGLREFEGAYYSTYRQRMLQRLGFEPRDTVDLENLLIGTVQFLQSTQVGYHDFFAELRRRFSELWYTDAGHILSESELFANPEWAEPLETWRSLYYGALQTLPEAAMSEVAERLRLYNPLIVPTRPIIEALWEPITTDDNWQPFDEFLRQLSR
ncbi:MAG: YdiU family protein [Thermosynechococcaceae cyanobacterium]